MPGDQQDDGKDVVLPEPFADATGDVWWDGGDSTMAVLAPGPSMTPAAASTAAQALNDGLSSVVPWLDIQVCGCPYRVFVCAALLLCLDGA